MEASTAMACNKFSHRNAWLLLYTLYLIIFNNPIYTLNIVKYNTLNPKYGCYPAHCKGLHQRYKVVCAALFLGELETVEPAG